MGRAKSSYLPNCLGETNLNCWPVCFCAIVSCYDPDLQPSQRTEDLMKDTSQALGVKLDLEKCEKIAESQFNCKHAICKGR